MNKHTISKQQDATSEERADLIERFRENVIGFERAAVKHFGAAGGIFARQLLFWDGKGGSEDFWIYKSHAEWYKDTGLKRRAQESARKRLIEAGVMREEKRIGPDQRWRLFFRLDPWKLMEVVAHDLPNAVKTPANPTVADSTQTMAEVPQTMADTTGYTEEHPQDHSEEPPLTTSSFQSEVVQSPQGDRGPSQKEKQGAARGADATTSLSGDPTPQEGQRGEAVKDLWWGRLIALGCPPPPPVRKEDEPKADYRQRGAEWKVKYEEWEEKRLASMSDEERRADEQADEDAREAEGMRRWRIDTGREAA